MISNSQINDIHSEAVNKIHNIEVDSGTQLGLPHSVSTVTYRPLPNSTFTQKITTVISTQLINTEDVHADEKAETVKARLVKNGGAKVEVIKSVSKPTKLESSSAIGDINIDDHHIVKHEIQESKKRKRDAVDVDVPSTIVRHLTNERKGESQKAIINNGVTMPSYQAIEALISPSATYDAKCQYFIKIVDSFTLDPSIPLPPSLLKISHSGIININCDGACRGNPGVSSSAAILQFPTASMRGHISW